jgi:hypothetical protein
MAGPGTGPGRDCDANPDLRLALALPPGAATGGHRFATGPGTMRYHLTNRDRYRIRAGLVITFLVFLVWAGLAGYLCDGPPGYCQ